MMINEINTRFDLLIHADRHYVKIDFDRPPLDFLKKMPKISSSLQASELILNGQITEDVFISEKAYVSEYMPFLRIMEKQFAIIATILGLNVTDCNNHYLCFSNLGNKLDGLCLPPEDGTSGVVILSKENFSRFFSLQKNFPKLILAISFFLIEIIVSLAHEMYHMRQSIFFPKTFKKKMKTYVSSLEDSEIYASQILEFGSNMFSQKYFNFLQSHADLFDDDLLRTALSHSKEYKSLAEMRDAVEAEMIKMS